MASALTSRQVPTYKIGPDGQPVVSPGVAAIIDAYGRTNNYATGELPYHDMNGGGPPQGTKHSRGGYPAADNSLSEPWPGDYDQTAVQNGRVRDRYTIASNPPSEFSQAYVDGMGAPGANQGTGPAVSPGQQAIIAALVNGGRHGSAYSGGWGARTPMQWETAPAGPAPQGDPWRRDRVNPTVLGETVDPGLVTGNRQQVPSLRAPNRIADLHTSLLAKQDAYRAKHPITYDQAPVTPGSGQTVNGVDMAFMPTSVQTSSRWRSGY